MPDKLCQRKRNDKVWLLTKHFQMTRPSQKLDDKCAGPYIVSKDINRIVYKLDQPKMMRNHNVFDVSQRDQYTPPVSGQR